MHKDRTAPGISVYFLEQGIRNPRTNELDWYGFETYATRETAVREAKKQKGKWRIAEHKIVWTSDND